MEESFNWIKTAIESCTNSFHLKCCHDLIELYRRMYGEGEPYCYRDLLAFLCGKEVSLSVDF